MGMMYKKILISYSYLGFDFRSVVRIYIYILKRIWELGWRLDGDILLGNFLYLSYRNDNII